VRNTLVSAGKSMASEAGKRLATRFIAAPQQNVVIPQPGFTPTPVLPPSSALPPAQQQANIPQDAVNPQAKLNEVIGKYNGSDVTLTMTQHNAITIQDLVRKMHQGSGLKMI
jgi:hypothetical protein